MVLVKEQPRNFLLEKWVRVNTNIAKIFIFDYWGKIGIYGNALEFGKYCC